MAVMSVVYVVVAGVVVDGARALLDKLSVGFFFVGDVYCHARKCAGAILCVGCFISAFAHSRISFEVQWQYGLPRLFGFLQL